jgi:hypothetical protein
LTLFAVAASLPWLVLSHFGIGRELAELRAAALVKSEQGPWDQSLEVRAGWLALGLARLGLSLATLPPELRAAATALRSAEVGLYQPHHLRQRLDRRALMSRADAAMTKRGWDRLVEAASGEELVAVYVPQTIRPNGRLSLCLMVANDDLLVLAAVTGDLQPILPYVLANARWPLKARPGVSAASGQGPGA